MGFVATEKKHRGYCDWGPRAATQHWLDCVDEILTQYRSYWPLTIRQIFYRLVASYEYDKTEQAYGRLINYLGRARRSRMIPFNAIRDDGAASRLPYVFESAGHWWANVHEDANSFQMDRLADQDVRIEIFCEAEGMLPLIAQAVSEYTVPVYSGGGFNSLTSVRNCAGRAIEDPRDTLIINFGDYDPSGESIFDSFRQDVWTFVAQATNRDKITFERAALTSEQVEEMGLPTAPPKPTDSRSKNWVGETCQLEAIPPNDLASLAVNMVSNSIDQDKYQARRAMEDAIRDTLVDAIASAEQKFNGGDDA